MTVEVHVRVEGLAGLHLPNRPVHETYYDLYASASWGPGPRHRTRVVYDTKAPRWDEEFVFASSPQQPSASSDGLGVIKFEILNNGIWSDEQLAFAYLDLDTCSGMQQLQAGGGDAAAAPAPDTCSGVQQLQAGGGDAAAPAPDSGSGIDDDEEMDAASIAAAAALSRRCVGGSYTGGRMPGAAGARAALEEAASAAVRATSRLLKRPAAFASSKPETLRLPLFPCGSGSGSRGGGSSSSSSSKRGPGLPGSLQQSKSKAKLGRSTHVTEDAGSLLVCVWFVQQPSLDDTGAPPRVISFVHPAGHAVPLPASTHTPLASLWEEPAVCFLRLVCGRVDLGPAAALLASGSAAGEPDEAGGSASSSRRGRSAKAVLKRLTAALRKKDEAAHLEAELAQALRARPSLSAIHGAGSLVSHRALDSSPQLGGCHFEALELPSDDSEDEPNGGTATDSDDEWEHAAAQPASRGVAWGSGAGEPPSSGHKGRSRRARARAARAQEVYLTVKIGVGPAPPKALRPVRLSPDGSAAPCQCAVFALRRPLQEAQVSYVLALGLGPDGPPIVSLSFSYSLLHLLRKSPPHPHTWDDWRAVARCKVHGLQVPLPAPPGCSLDLSAFLADADCRAGMYRVPPVAPEAVAQAAADDAAAARAAAEAAARSAAGAEASDEPLTGSEAGDDFAPAADERGSEPGSTSSCASSRGGSARCSSQRAVLRRRPAAQPVVPRGAASMLDSAAVDKLKSRVLAGVEAGLDRLPPTMAKQVKGRFINKLFRGAKEQSFAIGQLRVPSAPARAVLPPPAGSLLPAGSGASGAVAACSRPSSTGDLAAAAALAAVEAAGVAVDSAAAEAAAEAAAAVMAASVPLSEHPNLATAGSPGSLPLGILQLTIQAISVRKVAGSGVSLLLRSGPCWLQLAPEALPLATGSEGERAPPVQVLLPVFGSSAAVALVLHRKSGVLGRCVVKLYGLAPLLLRGATRALSVYSDRRTASGQRALAGSVMLRLSAAPPPGYGRLLACARLAFCYLITPHTLELHTSGVLDSCSRDELDDAHGEVVVSWLTGQSKHAVPAALVTQLVSTGRGALSATRMQGHVRRIKTVLLDWLPRRLDPLSFYHWRHPLHNILFLWLLGTALLFPARWAATMALLVSATLLRRIAIQVRGGAVLGFELEQLPPDMAAAAGLPDAAPQPVPGPGSEGADTLGELRSTCGRAELRGPRNAAHRLRTGLEAGKHKLLAHPAAASLAGRASPAPAAAFPTSLQELREQLEAGSLNLDSIDLEAAAKQLLSVGGLLRLARQHSTSLLDYALLAQNMLDDAASFAEGLYAALTAQDPLAALLLCALLCGSTAFCVRFGLGAGIWLVIAVLLRPPCMRGVPGLAGWKAVLANLPSRRGELAW